MPGIAGLLMDRFGLYRVVILLSTCVFLGQTIFSAALSWQWDFFWVVLGRMMFGFGGESLVLLMLGDLNDTLTSLL